MAMRVASLFGSTGGTNAPRTDGSFALEAASDDFDWDRNDADAIAYAGNEASDDDDDDDDEYDDDGNDRWGLRRAVAAVVATRRAVAFANTAMVILSWRCYDDVVIIKNSILSNK